MSPCSNSGDASAALSHMRASIDPVRSVRMSARYFPPSFLSRSDFVVAAKKAVTDWSSNFARSAMKISFIFAGTLQHRCDANTRTPLERGELAESGVQLGF